jgi:hypothetical protein
MTLLLEGDRLNRALAKLAKGSRCINCVCGSCLVLTLAPYPVGRASHAGSWEGQAHGSLTSLVMCHAIARSRLRLALPFLPAL